MSDKKNDAKVCICIPTYRAAATLTETVASIRCQTWTDWILHIVDNASDDETLNLAHRLANVDSRIRVHVNTKNIGAEGNFTRCLQMMNGEFGGIFHSDDIYHPNMLASAIADLDTNPAVAAVFCEAYNINSLGKRIGRRISRTFDRQEGELSIIDIKQALNICSFYGNVFVCPSALCRSSVLRNEIATWNGDKFKTSADLDVWLNIALRHRVAIRHSPLMSYRMSDASHSFRIANSRIEEHHLFLVLDHWRNIFPPSSTELARFDRNVRMSRGKDCINRAGNMLIQGHRTQALQLLIFSYTKLSPPHCFISPLHVRYRIFGIFTMLFIALSWSSTARNIFGRIKTAISR